MLNRELQRADGHAWYEPHWWDLEQERGGIRTTLLSHKCSLCGKILTPRTVIAIFRRNRTWTQTSAISGVFSGWSPWEVVGWKCPEDCLSIPF